MYKTEKFKEKEQVGFKMSQIFRTTAYLGVLICLQLTVCLYRYTINEAFQNKTIVLEFVV